MRPLTRQEYYVYFDTWAASTREQYISRLSSIGSHDEVAVVVNSIYTERIASKLLNAALNKVEIELNRGFLDMKNRTLMVLMVLFIMVIMLSSCSASFPSKEKISAMTSDEATKILENKTEKEIHDNWGEPDSVFSGMYGDIYIYDNKCIGAYYDELNESRVYRVLIWDKE